MPLRIFTALLSAWLAVSALSAPALGQHLDALVEGVNGQLATGTTNFDLTPPVTTLGTRVYSRSFDSGFAVNNPGFSSVGATTGTPPPGSVALPGNQDLFWDFLPMKVGGVTSNLLYWNGAGSTPAQVAFGLPPGVDYSLSLFGKNNVRAAVDGTANLIPGSVIETTAADGFIHSHRFFFLDNDHDDGNATVAAEGVYLIAMRLRMAGLDRSDPFYIVWGTPGTARAAFAAAQTWTTDRVDQLTPNSAADFDGDLDVDGADWLTWQRGLGTVAGALQIQGDANRDHAVAASDLDVWRSQFGSNLANLPGAATAVLSQAAPEPANAVLTASALMAFATHRRRPKPLGIGWYSC